ncbi:MAG: hypothetical protein AB1489_29470 [Acidobacteriota bacterium]
MASLLTKLKIKTESMPTRCEVCHQSDQFDPEKNHCSRCVGVAPKGQGVIEQVKVNLNHRLPVFTVAKYSVHSEILLMLAVIASVVAGFTQGFLEMFIILFGKSSIVADPSTLTLISEIGPIASIVAAVSWGLFWLKERDSRDFSKWLFWVNLAIFWIPVIIKIIKDLMQ